MGNPRASFIGRDMIQYTMQLVFDDAGGARMTRLAGKLAENERAMQLTVELPKSIFKRPALTAAIKVEPHEVSIPPVDLTAVQDALRDAFGAEVLLTIQTQEQP